MIQPMSQYQCLNRIPRSGMAIISHNISITAITIYTTKHLPRSNCFPVGSISFTLKISSNSTPAITIEDFKQTRHSKIPIDIDCFLTSKVRMLGAEYLSLRFLFKETIEQTAPLTAFLINEEIL